MWFHHVPWDRRMSSGRDIWDELVYRYQAGVQYVTWMRETWEALAPYVGARRFAEVKAKLATHEADAAGWRDASVNYFREFSGRPNPVGVGHDHRRRARARRLRPLRERLHDPRARGRVAGDHGRRDATAAPRSSARRRACPARPS